MRSTDRTRSQLVRYALDTFFQNDGVPTAAISQLSEHISLRLPADITEQVVRYADTHNVSPSDVLRCAVDVYLDLDNQHLGKVGVAHV